MKHLLLTFLILFQVESLKAQDFIWAKQFEGYSHIYGICSDPFDDLIVHGAFYAPTDFDPGSGSYMMTPATSADLFIEKLDADGNFKWAKQWAGMSGSTRGLAVDSLGNIYVCGFFTLTVDFDPGPGVYNVTSVYGSSDIFVLKLDSAGNFIWAKRLGDIENDGATGIAVRGSGICISGQFKDTVDFDPGPGNQSVISAGGTDLFVLKLDTAGDFIWVYTDGNTGNDEGLHLAIDASDNSYLIVRNSGGLTLTKLGNAGNELWKKALDPNIIFSAPIIANNSLYLSGNFYSTADIDPGPGVLTKTSAGDRDSYIAKLDTAADLVWGGQIGSIHYDGVMDICVDNTGNIFATGHFIGNCDFDPGPQQYLMSAVADANNWPDIYFLRLDAGGNFIWAGRVGNVGQDLQGGCTLDANGTWIIAASVSGTTDMNPGQSVYNLSSNVMRGTFIKLGATNSLLGKQTIKESVSVYPNPCTGTTYVSASTTIYNIQITDALGRVVYSAEPNQANAEIKIDVAPGVYYIRVQSGEEQQTQKLVINK